MGVPLAWGRVSIYVPSSQAFLLHHPSLAHHPCLARLASHSPPTGSRVGLGCGDPRAPQAAPSTHIDGSQMWGTTHSPLVLAAQGHPVGPAMET